MRIAPLALLALLAACDNKPAATTTTTPPSSTSSAPGAGPAPAAAAAEAPKGETTFYFGVRETHTNITFQSKNDLTDILGSTHNIVGSATINFEAGTGKCALSVPSVTLNSGMADRDNAMRSATWLSVKQFPNIEFKAEKAVLTDKPNGWTIDGQFTLRGVTKELSIKAEVKRVPASIAQKLGFEGSCVKVLTGFKVKLADYGIVIPPTAIATVQPEITIAIDMWGSTTKPPELVVKAPEEGDAPIKRTFKPRVSDAGIEGTKYIFGKKPQLATMVAVSETEIETITAKTSVIAGVLGIDKAKGVGMVRLAVPVDELQTGIALRDEHLRGADWFDTAKFKTIEFESTKITKKDEKSWSVEGDFTMHGVKKPITVDVVMREIPLELIEKAHWGETPGLGFAAKFKVKLSDFGVKVPQAAIAKVNDEWNVSIDLVALQKGE
jgi:polyisoprenoid-binding protein YceI